MPDRAEQQKKGIVKSDLGDTVIRIGCPPATDSGFQGVIFDARRKDKNNKEEEEKKQQFNVRNNGTELTHRPVVRAEGEYSSPVPRRRDRDRVDYEGCKTVV